MTRSDVLPFKQALELLEQTIAAAHGMVVTVLPRGSLQIAQPARLPEPLLKGYTREYHLEDRLTWATILGGKAIAGSSILRDGDKFVSGLLRENGLAFAAAAPLTAPIIDGYPGALVVLRTAEQGDFNAEEIRQLAEVAAQIDEIIAKAREARRGDDVELSVTLTPRPQGRLFVFNAAGEQIVPGDDFETLDARLRDGMAEHTRARLNRLNGELMTADRVQLADSRGDLWTFRSVTYTRYPAVGEGPFVVFCMQPSCAEWATVRPSDVQADAEMARLIPALKFMRQEFHRGPTLGEIAKQVHLSPVPLPPPLRRAARPDTRSTTCSSARSPRRRFSCWRGRRSWRRSRPTAVSPTSRTSRAASNRQPASRRPAGAASPAKTASNRRLPSNRPSSRGLQSAVFYLGTA
jgi:hypothetical protein